MLSVNLYPTNMNCTRCNKPYQPKPKATRQKYCSKKCNQRAYEERNAKRIVVLRKANYDANINRYRSYKEKWNQSEKGRINRKRWYEEHKTEVLERMKARPDYLLNIKYSNQAKRVLLRDRTKQCETCGTKEGFIDAHHIAKPRSNNSIENLMWLCRPHHARIHVIR